jgi:sulfopropanediol 3-dehydrogenase
VIRKIKSGRTAEARSHAGAEVRATVAQILDDIETRGETAVREYSERFDS